MPNPSNPALWQYVRWYIAVKSLPQNDEGSQVDPTIALPPDVQWAVLQTLKDLYPDCIDIRVLSDGQPIEVAEPGDVALVGVDRWDILPQAT